MIPWKRLDSARGPDGQEFVLQERNGVYVIRVGGHELMSSAQHGSEEAMAEAGLAALPSAKPRVLIGGLGLGYTLRATLDRLPSTGSVVVAELSEAVVAWNRGPLAKLAGAPLEDPRVCVEVGDVRKRVTGASRRYDAILLDVDNGPEALTRPGNQQLYGTAGLAAFRDALVPGGALVVWSRGPDARFLARLRDAGFDARVEQVAARQGSGARHTLFVGRVPRS